jgi:hypothetical protein
MQIDVIPTLIDQYRETFEGEVTPGMCWITDGRRESALLGTPDALPAGQAFAAPAPGAKPIAAHVAHLRFTLDVTLRRLRGEDPQPDWPASFDLPDDRSEAAWRGIRDDLRRSYEGVLAFLQARRAAPMQDWPPIHLAGLAATIAHNAYHLGAIRQMARALVSRSP